MESLRLEQLKPELQAIHDSIHNILAVLEEESMDKGEISDFYQQNISELLELSKVVRANFNDENERFILLSRFRAGLKVLWDMSKAHGKYFRQIVLLLQDSLLSLTSEELEIKHLETFDSILQRLMKDSVSLEDARQVNRILLDADLDTLSWSGIADLYTEET
ncbi:hypothetical protein H8E77_17550 [bacterium]|nr:hypothetical protein [bacterium]